MSLLLKPVPAARGARWMRDAFALYARRPLAFTMLFVAFLFAALLTSLLPVVGGVLQMMCLPMVSLGFMVASQSALLGGPVTPSQFIEPLRGDAGRRRSLLALCLIYGLSAVAILWLCDTISDGAMQRLMVLASQGEAKADEVEALLAEGGVSLAGISFFVLVMLLSVPFWHAPALVHWGGQGAGQALFSSTLAVWRAKGAFLVYSLSWAAVFVVFVVGAALVFSVLGLHQLVQWISLPAGLMFSTVFYVSLLFAFNDSFGGGEARTSGIEAR
jgi:hypothetical protein